MQGLEAWQFIFIADRSLLNKPLTLDLVSNPSDFHLSPLPALFLFINAPFAEAGAVGIFFVLG